MSDLTVERKATTRANPEDSVLPLVMSFPVGAVAVKAGLVAQINSSGYAVSATAATNRVVGRYEQSVDNIAGSAGALAVDVRPGCYYLDNDSSLPVRQQDLLKPCYLIDNHTVSRSSSSGTYPYAGIPIAIRADGQIAVELGVADPYVATDYTQTRYYARGSCIANMSLSAFTVGTNTDGITYVAGDVVLLVGQTNTADNGPYVVGAVATTAPLTRPTWWASGNYVQPGAVIELGGEGTLRGGMSYKSFVATSTVVIGTTTPLLYPQFVRGTAAISSGTASVATVSITAQAKGVCSDSTTANKTATMALTAGADQTGSIAFAGGNGTDNIDYLVCNW